jgi:hypothetical protein
MGVVLGVVGKAAQEIKGSGLPDSAITPRRPPKGYYDTFVPGDLLYTTFDDALSGVTRAHYAVYLGKNEEGRHTIAHANTKEGKNGEVLGSHVVKQTMDDYSSDRSFKKAERTKGAGKQPTAEQLQNIIKEIEGKDFAWDGFKENCETFARGLANDLPISTQSESVNAVTKELVAGIMKIAFPGLGKAGQLKGKDVKEVSKRVVGDALMVDVTEDVDRVIRSVYGVGLQKVLSASLDGDNIVGLFRGSPRPGESRYYNYTLSTAGDKASVRYKQSIRGDAADKPCDCEECKKEKRMKSNCGCKSDSVECLRLAIDRLDKACGNSFIPEGHECNTGKQQAKGKKQPFLVKRNGDYYLLDDPSEKQAGDEDVNYLPKEASTGSSPKKKKKGSLLKKVAIGAGVLAGANIAGSAALNAYYAHRLKKMGFFDSQDVKPNPLVEQLRAAIANLDAKCGGGGISEGETCHIGSGDKSIHSAIGMGASVLSGGSIDKLVRQKHGVDEKTAREFSQSLNAVFRQGGAMAARKHYEAWSRHNVKTAKTLA